MKLRTIRRVGLPIAIACSAALLGPAAAEARVYADSKGEFASLCRDVQWDWDLWLVGYDNLPNDKRIGPLGASYKRKLSAIRKEWNDLGCQDKYGSIAKLTQWSGGASEWGASSFGASHTVVGDFNGDGRADVSVFAQGAEFSGPSAPSAKRYDLYTANRKPVPGTGGNGDFVAAKITNPALQEFRGWATNPGAKVLAGDFNGDKRADYVDIDPNSGSIAVAFSQGSGNFQTPVGHPSNFADLVGDANAKVVVGDFNGDGKDDLAAAGNSGWTGVKVATSTGTGTFNVTSLEPGGQFTTWAADAAAKLVAGDFNGDHKDDLLLHGKKCWTQGPDSCAQVIPIAYATATGFTADQHPYVTGYNRAAADSANYEQAHVVVGDYNADGSDDLVVFSSLKHPLQADTFLDDVNFIALNGTVNFGTQIISSTRDQLLAKVVAGGGVPLAGDFDRDGNDDIVVAGQFDDNKMPAMFYKGANQDPVFTNNMVSSPTCVPPTCGGTNG
ncbi:FG-GAP repeat domain-containing protein [Streptomyces sp. 1222.5]|uniref:FG-GAP repeat domain-containing protein n=1 Tax=Streptomyces sp. 1222.5 TaxID=1881026 RepID=UPI003EBE26FD